MKYVYFHQLNLQGKTQIYPNTYACVTLRIIDHLVRKMYQRKLSNLETIEKRCHSTQATRNSRYLSTKRCLNSKLWVKTERSFHSFFFFFVSNTWLSRCLRISFSLVLILHLGILVLLAGFRCWIRHSGKVQRSRNLVSVWIIGSF